MLKLLMLLTALIALPCTAEIYKWTDEKGKLHFSDVPPPKQEKEIIVVEPPPLSGTVINAPSSGSYYPSNQHQKNQALNKRKNDNAQRANEKAAKQRACDNAKQALARTRDLRGQLQSKHWRDIYNRKIDAAKRHENDACKLSNFR